MNFNRLLSNPLVVAGLKSGALLTTQMQKDRDEEEALRREMALKSFEYQQKNLDATKSREQQLADEVRQMDEGVVKGALLSGQREDLITGRVALKRLAPELQASYGPVIEEKDKFLSQREDEAALLKVRTLASSKVDAAGPTETQYDEGIKILKGAIKERPQWEAILQGDLADLETNKKLVGTRAQADFTLDREIVSAYRTKNIDTLTAALNNDGLKASDKKRNEAIQAMKDIQSGNTSDARTAAQADREERRLAISENKETPSAAAEKTARAMASTVVRAEIQKRAGGDNASTAALIQALGEPGTDSPETLTKGAGVAGVDVSGLSELYWKTYREFSGQSAPSVSGGFTGAGAGAGQPPAAQSPASPGFSYTPGAGIQYTPPPLPAVQRPSPGLPPAPAGSGARMAAQATGLIAPAAGGQQLGPAAGPVIGPQSEQEITRRMNLYHKTRQQVIDEATRLGLDLTQ